jgi:hypothetical protein
MSLPHDEQYKKGILSMIANRILFCPAEERTARELQQLPQKEREQVWADMTANPETTFYRIHAEEPTFVQKSLDLMALNLESLTDKPAYDLALRLSPDYVSNPKLRLMFIRSEAFDTHAAAVRMANHFKLKLALFGEDKLGRDILLSDLDEGDMESLKAGGMQALSHCDMAERTIVFTRQLDYKYKKRENIVSTTNRRSVSIPSVVLCCVVNTCAYILFPIQLRAMWYLSMCITESEKVQKLGVVSISYQVGGYPEGGYDFELTRKVSTLIKVVPVRFVAIYLCYSETPWQRVADLISHMVSPILRVRLRSIQGEINIMSVPTTRSSQPGLELPVVVLSIIIVLTYLISALFTAQVHTKSVFTKFWRWEYPTEQFRSLVKARSCYRIICTG